MGRIWSDQNKFQQWLEVELAAAEALAELGIVPAEAAGQLRRHAGFDVARILEIEKEVKHDVIAFTTAVAESMAAAGCAGSAEASRWLHYGLTSNDVVDTAQALLLRQAAAILDEDLEALRAVLRRRALEFRQTVQMGRTHGVHAEPITFGLVMALWYAEMERNLERLGRAKENIAYGKISGAVGTFAHLAPAVEEYVCKKCGLKPAPISNQIIQRDRHAEFFTTLALVAASVEKIALEVRHLQRTEVSEAEEPFSSGQKGSSAMPHKRNPIASENLMGLSRVLRAHALAALEDVALWHERDISHSSVERIIGPDSTILLDYMLHRVTQLVDRLVVYPGAMKANLERSRGLIFSEGILLRLVQKGLTREEAYALTQGAAFRTMRRKKDFRAILMRDHAIRRYLKPQEIQQCLDLSHSLRYVKTIFRRVFGKQR